jgi:hypothetical protein
MNFLRVHRDRLIDISRAVAFMLVLDLFLETPLLFKFSSIYSYSEAISYPIKIYNSAIHTFPFNLINITPQQYMWVSGIIQLVGLVTLITNPSISGLIGMVVVGLNEYGQLTNPRLMPPNPLCVDHARTCLTTHVLHVFMFACCFIVFTSPVGLGGAFTRATQAVYGIRDDLLRAGEQVKDMAMDVAGTVQEKTAASLGPIKDKAYEIADRTGLSNVTHNVAQKLGLEHDVYPQESQLRQEGQFGQRYNREGQFGQRDWEGQFGQKNRDKIGMYDVDKSNIGQESSIVQPSVIPQEGQVQQPVPYKKLSETDDLSKKEIEQPLLFQEENQPGWTDLKGDAELMQQRGELDQKDWPPLTPEPEKRFAEKRAVEDVNNERLGAGQSA